MISHSRPGLKWQLTRLSLWLSGTNRVRWRVGLATAICVAGILFRMAPIATSRFHQDEAVYGYWALQITTGQDPWLSQFPVDKPPLYIYTLALFLQLFGPTETGARLPSELASAASLILIYMLGRRLYGSRTALVALAVFALSPFGILFAPTAMTDPLMVAWVLAALVAASYQRWGWAGFLLSLGFITKPQAILFLPLAIALGIRRREARADSDHAQAEACNADTEPRTEPPPSAVRTDLAYFALGCMGAVVPAIAWDMLSSRGTGFFAQGITSYGGLHWAPAVAWSSRLLQWCDILQYATGSALLNAILLGGLPLLLLYGVIRRKMESERRLDWIFVLFAVAFLVVHTVLEFNAWDRYLLGLIPIIALILGRILLVPGDLISAVRPGLKHGLRVYEVGLALLLVLALLRPVQDAASSRFPHRRRARRIQWAGRVGQLRSGTLAGRHGALSPLAGVALFLLPVRFPLPAPVVHRARRTGCGRRGAPRCPALHRFPRAGSPRLRPAGHYGRTGWSLSPVYETYRDNGTRSFTLYRIEETDSDG